MAIGEVPILEDSEGHLGDSEVNQVRNRASSEVVEGSPTADSEVTQTTSLSPKVEDMVVEDMVEEGITIHLVGLHKGDTALATPVIRYQQPQASFHFLQLVQEQQNRSRTLWTCQ